MFYCPIECLNFFLLPRSVLIFRNHSLCKFITIPLLFFKVVTQLSRNSLVKASDINSHSYLLTLRELDLCIIFYLIIEMEIEAMALNTLVKNSPTASLALQEAFLMAVKVN